MKLWSEFNIKRLAKESEVSIKTDITNRIESQLVEVRNEYDLMNKEQNIRCSELQKELCIEQLLESNMKAAIGEKKKILDDMHLKERESDKKISDCTNFMIEVQKRIIEVKHLTRKLTDRNIEELETIKRVIEDINEIIKALGVKRQTMKDINSSKRNYSKASSKRQIVYSNRNKNAELGPRVCSCKCNLF